MIGPLDERQACDDFRRVLAYKPHPPGAVAQRPGGAHHAEIALRGGDRINHRARAMMRHIGHGEAEMETGAVPHLRVAAGIVRVHRIIRLHIGESRDDDAPHALHGVDRQ